MAKFYVLITFGVILSLCTGTPKVCASADMNGDHFVNFADLSLFAGQWLTSVDNVLAGDDLMIKRPWVDARFYGSSLNSSTIYSAINSIGTSELTLLLTPGTWQMTGTVIVPSNITLRLERGCKISVNSGVFEVDGPIECGTNYAFDGDGIIKLKNVREIYPEWWGAKGDGLDASAATNTTAIRRALNCLSRSTISFQPSSGTNLGSFIGATTQLKFLGGHYKINDQIELPGYVDVEGCGQTIIEQTNQQKGIFKGWAYQTRISKITFLKGTRQLYLYNPNVDSMIDIDNCQFHLSSDYAIYTCGTTAPGSVYSLASAATPGSKQVTLAAAGLNAGTAIVIYNNVSEPHLTYIDAANGVALTLRNAIPQYWTGTHVAGAGARVEVGDFHMSTELNIERCKFIKPRKVLMNVCDYATVRNSWVYVDKGNFEPDSAVFSNAMGVLILDEMIGVPTMGTGTQRLDFVRWIDQGEGMRYWPTGIKAIKSRFGGEDSGIPIVYSYLKPATQYPFMGGFITITDCLACGGASDRPDSSIINLRQGVPQLISVVNNDYIFRPYILNGTGYSLSQVISSLPQPHMVHINISPNMHLNAGSLIPTELEPFVVSDSYR